MKNGSVDTTDPATEERSLVDTNVVVYSYDPRDPRKQAIAIDLMGRLSGSGSLVYSAQVLNEFCRAMTRPNRGPNLPLDQLAAAVRRLIASAEVVPIVPAITLRALDAIPRHGFSFWDALIWAAAKENGVSIVYTEDFQHGRDVEGVRIVNPFAPGD